MTTRLPQKRYIGDGVYVGHDGYQITLETSDGNQMTNRIALDSTTIQGLKRYLEYAQEFYKDDQHLVGPECEGCQKDITNHSNPMSDVIQGEVYHVKHEDTQHEIRLCSDCSKSVDQPFLISLIEKRPSYSSSTGE